MNGVDAFDVDKLKQEIMTEIRREVSKMKQDIIEGESGALSLPAAHLGAQTAVMLRQGWFRPLHFSVTNCLTTT